MKRRRNTTHSTYRYLKKEVDCQCRKVFQYARPEASAEGPFQDSDSESSSVDLGNAWQNVSLSQESVLNVSSSDSFQSLNEVGVSDIPRDSKPNEDANPLSTLSNSSSEDSSENELMNEREFGSKPCSKTLPLVGPDGNITEQTVRRLFRTMGKLREDIRNKFGALSRDILEVKALQMGETVKTKDNIIPGVQLPAKNPNELKVVDDYLKSSPSARTEYVNFMKPKAVGTKAVDISNGIMQTVMTHYCAAYFVWDGIHTGTVRGKLALKTSLPSLEQCLQEVIEGAATALITKTNIKFHAGRYLTLSSKKLTDKDPPFQPPWTFGQAIPSRHAANQDGQGGPNA